MALGGVFNNKGDDANNGTEHEKSAPPFQDPENLSGGQKWGRIDKPIGSIVGKRASVAEGAELDESGNDISIGKQLEMEEDNAIKYRSCGWKKVCSAVFVLFFALRKVCWCTQDRSSLTLRREYPIANYDSRLLLFCSPNIFA
jgi:hypothetical protein